MCLGVVVLQGERVAKRADCSARVSLLEQGLAEIAMALGRAGLDGKCAAQEVYCDRQIAKLRPGRTEIAKRLRVVRLQTKRNRVGFNRRFKLAGPVQCNSPVSSVLRRRPGSGAKPACRSARIPPTTRPGRALRQD